MTLYNEERTVKITKGDELKTTAKLLYLRQYEYDGTKIIAHVVDDDGKPVNVTGYTAVYWMRNKNGDTVQAPATVDNAATGQVSVVVTHDMTAEAGPVAISYFELVNGKESVTTDNIPILVMKSADLSNGEVRKYQTEIDKMVEQLEELTAHFRDIDHTETTYQEGTSTTVPTGTWTTAIPQVGQGRYLWQRNVVVYSDKSTHTTYLYARQGQDNVTWGAATTSKDGLMSASDKKNLDDLKTAWDSAGYKLVGREISDSFDLDDCRSLGLYRCRTSTIAASLKNSPTQKAFWMWIESCIGGDFWQNQIIVTRDNEIYIRMCNADRKFSNWREIQTVTV